MVRMVWKFLMLVGGITSLISFTGKLLPGYITRFNEAEGWFRIARVVFDAQHDVIVIVVGVFFVTRFLMYVPENYFQEDSSTCKRVR